MITETTRDNAIQAALNGRISMVIYRKNGHPDIANLTQILGDVFSGEGNVYIADIEPEPLKVPEPVKKDSKLIRVRDKAEFIKENSGGRKSDLDEGKLSALYKNNWTIRKIADEMGVSEKTIQNHLRKLREEGKL